jgi:hypothetical protein
MPPILQGNSESLRGSKMITFISKRRHVSFEGCGFRFFTYETDNEYKIKKLRTSRFYGRDFMELKDGEDAEEIINSTVRELSLEDLRKMLAEKELEIAKVKDTTVYTIEDDYKELKRLAKNAGMEWKKMPKKEVLVEFLNGNQTT